jgi:thiamine biosynthesis protein ThiS
MASITLNGKPREIANEMPVPEFLIELDVNPKQVAVAINGEVVPRSTWAGVSIKDGDVVEVVRAVGGG